ncbi:exo-beta-N-acetylmuramidase NamZ domain-containing protein [Streptomyces desertarenae]|uniref:Exo-beta-N-acetylmuramidase NamZ domain-containing protein n=1 Tax=Streptomyces desertarenae TaxID=2666184 RepID=A0ABW4PII3_9ACTN
MPSRRSLLAGGAAAALAAPLASPATAATAADGPSGGRSRGRDVVPGADAAAARGWSVLRGRRVGVISNPTGVLRDATHIVDSMAAHGELDIAGVFGPEHGFRGSAQAGESEPEFTDPRTGLTVYDAYGANATRMAELFTRAGADTIVFDIQDVGVRYYTYIWTMYSAMVAARSIGARFVVLDRPNPIGRRADGPLMTEEFTSGVGAEVIVQQHGMTVGELARYFNGELLPKEGPGGTVELEVVPVRGWDPYSTAHEHGLPWVPPSPNMPTPDTAVVYAGTGYFEGTNLSEGRGTTRPFELIGAPYLDHRYSDRLNARKLPGVRFREGYFVPTFGKHTGTTCGGVQIHVTDPRRYEPVTTAVAMLVEARRYDAFAWRQDAWDTRRPFWIDKLSGSPRLRGMVDAGKDVDEITAAWREEVRAFERTRRAYLLYR